MARWPSRNSCGVLSDARSVRHGFRPRSFSGLWQGFFLVRGEFASESLLQDGLLQVCEAIQLLLVDRFQIFSLRCYGFDPVRNGQLVGNGRKCDGGSAESARWFKLLMLAPSPLSMSISRDAFDFRK